uniref:Uncharacterized protein n=1 Tax=Haemonchus contortus TaxID=6289 RepID=A0A7I4Y2J9_HAECO
MDDIPGKFPGLGRRLRYRLIDQAKKGINIEVSGAVDDDGSGWLAGLVQEEEQQSRPEKGDESAECAEQRAQRVRAQSSPDHHRRRRHSQQHQAMVGRATRPQWHSIQQAFPDSPPIYVAVAICDNDVP